MRRRVVGVVLYEAAAEDSLSRWVYDEVLTRDMRARVAATRYIAVADAADDASAMLRAACGVLRDACADDDNDDDAAATGATVVVLLLLAIYWDGQAEASKASFARLKQLADAKGRACVSVCQACLSDTTTTAAAAAATAATTTTTTTTTSMTNAYVLVQALNAKKGQHTIPQSRVALLASLERKLDTVTVAAAAAPTTAAVTTTSDATTAAADAAARAGSSGTRRDGSGDAPVTAHAGARRHADPTTTTMTTTGDTADAASHLTAAVHTSSVDVSAAALSAAVDDGQGECIYALRASTLEQLAQLRATMLANCAAAEVGAAAILPEPRLVSNNSSSDAAAVADAAATMAVDGKGSHNSDNGNTSTATATVTAAGASAVYVQEYLLRRDRADTHMELRLAMCGNVDSGKSTLTSVLTRGCHDDGRGYARAFVFNHKHEAATGRTSSISENHLGFTATGDVANYLTSDGGAGNNSNNSSGKKTAAAAHSSSSYNDKSTDNNNNNNKDSDGSRPSSHVATTTTTTTSSTAAAVAAAVATTRPYTPQELARRSAKVFTLYDLAGHEKYLKTTVLGMTRNIPDYACIVISANNGIQRMTREHLVLCLALRLPFFIVLTRIDATPANVLAETRASIHKLLKIPMVRRLPYPVRSADELVLAARHVRHERMTPIFEVSNVTGQGVSALLRFLNLLPLRKDWRRARTLPKQMVIDTTFFVVGVGTVVGGVVTQGVFRVNDVVLLGPDGLGHFRPVTIRSIHVRGVDSTHADAGSDAAFCLKKERRNAIRKGNVLADPQHPPQAYWQFEAEVTILYHSTTITTNYEPVIHSTTVRQSARITYVAKEVLRTGDRSLVRFHFIYRPEFILVGQRIIFREGRAKGIGVVTALLPTPDEALLRASKPHRRQALAAGVKLSSGGGGGGGGGGEDKTSKRV